MKTFLLLVNAERALCQIEWKKLRDGTNHSSIFPVVELHITYTIGVALQHLYPGIIPLSKNYWSSGYRGDSKWALFTALGCYFTLSFHVPLKSAQSLKWVDRGDNIMINFRTIEGIYKERGGLK